MTSEPIQYDASGCFAPRDDVKSPDTPLHRAHLLDPAARDALLGKLDIVRKRIASADYPADWHPLDSGFVSLPRDLLAERKKQRRESILGRIQQAGAQMRRFCDRVVLMGIGGSSMGTRALFGALCHPYHNELTRMERGRVPRLYFEGDNVDSDSLYALETLLQSKCTDPKRAATRFGLIVISKSGTTLETSVAYRILRRRAQAFYSDSPELYRNSTIVVTGGDERSKLRQIATADGLAHIFDMPDNVGGRYSILTAVGLVPAAVLGLDVPDLLRGAADMTDRFLNEPVEANPVLQHVAVAFLTERRRGATIRVMSSWSKRLEWFGYWYDQLLAESLGKFETGATPITAVGSRDLHSRGQQHQQGRRDKVILNLRIGQPTHPAVAIGPSNQNFDDLDSLQTKSLVDCMNAASDGTNQAYYSAARPTADLRIPTIDPYALGQLFQFFMLATIAEGMLVDVNPFGQPGVEDYKRNMNSILRGREA